jgi:hypothetical protein
MAMMLVRKVLIDLLGRDFRDAVMAHLEGGVVYQDVESPEGIDGLLYDLLAVCFIPDVARHEHRLAPCLLDHTFGLLSVRVFIQV